MPILKFHPTSFELGGSASGLLCQDVSIGAVAATDGVFASSVTEGSGYNCGCQIAMKYTITSPCGATPPTLASVKWKYTMQGGFQADDSHTIGNVNDNTGSWVNYPAAPPCGAIQVPAQFGNYSTFSNGLNERVLAVTWSQLTNAGFRTIMANLERYNVNGLPEFGPHRTITLLDESWIEIDYSCPTPPTPNVVFTKNTSGPTTVGPGAVISSQLIVGNTGAGGTGTAVGVSISDPVPTVPASIGRTWTRVVSGGVVGGPSANVSSGTGPISQVLDIPLGVSVTYSIQDLMPGAGTIGTPAKIYTNTATVGVPDGNITNSGSVSGQNITVDAGSAPPPPPGPGTLGITLSRDKATAMSGETVTWTVILSATGGSVSVPSGITVDLPIQTSNVTWQASGVGGPTGLPVGAQVTEPIVLPAMTMPSSSQVILNITGTVTGSTGVVLVVGVTNLPGGITPPTPVSTTIVAPAPTYVLDIDAVGCWRTADRGQKIRGGWLIENVSVNPQTFSVAFSVPTEIAESDWEVLLDAPTATANFPLTGKGSILGTITLPPGSFAELTLTARVKHTVPLGTAIALVPIINGVSHPVTGRVRRDIVCEQRDVDNPQRLSEMLEGLSSPAGAALMASIGYDFLQEGGTIWHLIADFQARRGKLSEQTMKRFPCYGFLPSWVSF